MTKLNVKPILRAILSSAPAQAAVATIAARIATVFVERATSQKETVTGVPVLYLGYRDAVVVDIVTRTIRIIRTDPETQAESILLEAVVGDRDILNEFTIAMFQIDQTFDPDY